jgi:23S rRNA pseudouridine1911/1915/1917 synthase
MMMRNRKYMGRREFTFTIKKEDEGMGIRRMLKKNLDFSSRLLAKMRAQHLVFLNGKVLEGWMKPKEGDVIRAVLPEERSGFPPEDIPFQVIYEDQDLLIIDKPAGYTVHPTKGHPNHTMANGIMKYMDDHHESWKIRFVNRLDMDTTGLLIVGKNSHAQDELIRQMQKNRLHKTYCAIVSGIIEEDAFTIDRPIGMPDPDKPSRAVMEGGRDSITKVKVLERIPAPSDGAKIDGKYENSGHTLVELNLLTGRTHQIRVHLSSIGHPITGDPLYGGDLQDRFPRQALHARRLEFRHPAEDRIITVEAPLPDDMDQLLKQLRLESKRQIFL